MVFRGCRGGVVPDLAAAAPFIAPAQRNLRNSPECASIPRRTTGNRFCVSFSSVFLYVVNPDTPTQKKKAAGSGRRSAVAPFKVCNFVVADPN
jgi:hypothetical protein